MKDGKTQRLEALAELRRQLAKLDELRRRLESLGPAIADMPRVLEEIPPLIAKCEPVRGCKHAYDVLHDGGRYRVEVRAFLDQGGSVQSRLQITQRFEPIDGQIKTPLLLLDTPVESNGDLPQTAQPECDPLSLHDRVELGFLLVRAIVKSKTEPTSM